MSDRTQAVKTLTMSATIEVESKRSMMKIDTEGNRIEPGTWEVVSMGDGGFDRVTRPDYFSAKSAMKVHKSATGNECEINPVYGNE